MKTYKVKGTMLIDVEWEVVAEDEHDALSEFYAADARDIIDDSRITDVNTENEEAVLVEADIIVRVKGIDYDVDFNTCYDIVSEDFGDLEDEDPDAFDDLIYSKMEEIKNKLPKDLDIKLACVDMTDEDSISDQLVDAISEQTGWLINSFESYQILEVK